MLLVVTLLVGTVGLAALFWGLTQWLQTVLYSSVAERLPLRALAAGLAVTLFITGWTYLNTRAAHKDKYGTLFEFNPTATQDVAEFEAVRRFPNVKDAGGKLKETTVPFQWAPSAGGSSLKFVDPATGQEFRRSNSDYMTAALLVPENGAKVRYAVEEERGAFKLNGNKAAVFREEGGSRTITDDNLHQVNVPSPGAFAAAVLLNVGLFAVWFVACWLGLRFTIAHALLLTALFGGVSLFILMPLLFNLNAVKVAAGH